LGFEIFHTDARDLIGHGGGFPGYVTATHISPAENVGVIVFANAQDAEPYPGEPRSISQRIFEWVAPALLEAVGGDEVDVPDPRWARLEGTYRARGGDIHVLPLDGTLTIVNPLLPDPKAGIMTLEPVAENTFRLDGKGYDAFGEHVVFEIGPEGRSDAVTIGDGFRYTRVSYGLANPIP